MIVSTCPFFTHFRPDTKFLLMMVDHIRSQRRYKREWDEIIRRNSGSSNHNVERFYDVFPIRGNIMRRNFKLPDNIPDLAHESDGLEVECFFGFRVD